VNFEIQYARVADALRRRDLAAILAFPDSTFSSVNLARRPARLSSEPARIIRA
jgi:hypothetical protein